MPCLTMGLYCNSCPILSYHTCCEQALKHNGWFGFFFSSFDFLRMMIYCNLLFLAFTWQLTARINLTPNIRYFTTFFNLFCFFCSQFSYIRTLPSSHAVQTSYLFACLHFPPSLLALIQYFLCSLYNFYNFSNLHHRFTVKTECSTFIFIRIR